MRERTGGVAGFLFPPQNQPPFPQKPPGLRPPLEVTAAWSKLMPRPATTSPERGTETVVVKRESPIHKVRDPAPSAHPPAVRPVTTSPETDDQRALCNSSSATVEERLAACRSLLSPWRADAVTWFNPRPL